MVQLTLQKRGNARPLKKRLCLAKIRGKKGAAGRKASKKVWPFSAATQQTREKKGGTTRFSQRGCQTVALFREK